MYCEIENTSEIKMIFVKQKEIFKLHIFIDQTCMIFVQYNKCFDAHHQNEKYLGTVILPITLPHESI